mgnify:CR=1 FL=1
MCGILIPYAAEKNEERIAATVKAARMGAMISGWEKDRPFVTVAL